MTAKIGIRAQMDNKRDERKRRDQKEAKKILSAELKHTMSNRQKGCFAKRKKIVESKGCNMISTAYIDVKTKIVIECSENKLHGIQIISPPTLSRKSKSKSTLCKWCNLSKSAVKQNSDRRKKRIKIANEIKSKEKDKLTPEEIILKDIKLFSSNAPLKDKKNRILILNANKKKPRSKFCIEENCMTRSCYGYEGLPVHCEIHKLDCEIRSVHNPCTLCSKHGSIELDGKKYCSNHAKERGYKGGKRKWNETIDEEDLEHSRKRRYNHNNYMQKGENAEQFMVDLLKLNIIDANINHVGYKSAPLFDIEIKFEDLIWRGIQVRTLSKILHRKNSWRFPTLRIDGDTKNKTKYPNNTLFIACNEEKSLFVSIFSQDINGNSFNYNADNEDSISKYDGNVFTNVDEFILSIKQRAKNAVKVDGLRVHGKTNEKEYKMVKKLEEICNEKGFLCEVNKSVFSCVDLIINNWNIQCKFSTRGKDGYTFCVNTNMALKTRSGKRKTVPYDLGDNIDILIIRLESKSNPDKYQNDFLIIPKDALISLGIIQTPTQPGKTGISVPSRDYHKKEHPMLKYWNEWKFLEEKKDKININQIRDQYTSEQLKIFAEQEREEKISYLDGQLIEVTYKISALTFKLEKFKDIQELQFEELYLNSTLKEKLSLYRFYLKKYLMIYGYMIHRRKEENKFILLNVISKESHFRIMSNKNIFDLLELAKQYLPTNTFICLPRSVVYVVMSYLKKDLQLVII